MATRTAGGAGAYTQASRPIGVTTELGADKLILVGFDGEEAVSQPFHYTLHLVSADPEIDTAKLVRSKASLRIDLPNGEQRMVHGRFATFVQLDSDGDLTSYRAELVPPVWFLSLMRDSRVFAGLHVNEIVETILDEAGLASGTDWEVKLHARPPKLRWSAQYRESSLDYVSRIMESAGLFYYFVHTDDGSKMMITDANDTSEYPPGAKEVRMAPVGGTAVLGEDTITHLARENRARAGKVTLADYNFRTPSSRLLTTLAGEHPEEVYEYPARSRDRQEGDTIARVRLEELEALNVMVRGSGPCRTIRAGGRFELVDHYRPEFNTTYLALRVSLYARITGLRTSEETTFTYGAELQAIPFAVPYRPPRITPAPTVAGIQTAVVGPAGGGEEIMVDKYGRIPIQYHWDRRNKDDGKPSVWARVAQPWAGKTWGSISIPRIGQEVVVEFLEGDPDRPLVTGSVYNGEQMPPYELPGNQTRSTTKTRSSPGGGPANFNEIRFEDKKGSEELYIHAEKNRVVVVENNNTESVGNDESISVGSDQSLSVGANQSISVGKDRTESVGGAESISIAKDRGESVGGSENVNVGKDRSHSIGANDRLDVGKDRSVSVAKNVIIQVGEKRTTNVGKDDVLTVGKKLAISAADEVSIVCGKSSITLKKDGTIAIKGKDISLNGSGKIEVKASSDVKIKGSKVSAN